MLIRIYQNFSEEGNHQSLMFRQIHGLPDKTTHGTAIEIA
tara:strand:+ start:926 stop:1045 length:120 start_codon:yes stop_codon:yes gene_type:complete